nr:hypothetical protein [Tanacetum cinerariifolium]
MAWYETLSTFLVQDKFVKERIDNTLFIYRSKREVLLVQVYVDDIIFGSTSYKLCKQLEKLMIKKFEMSMMGELSYFLGLQIKHYDKGISIYQEQYIRNLLKKYEISDSSLVKTSMVPPNNLGLYLAVKPFNEALYKGMIRYLKGTLSLGLYYLKCSRFDLKRYLDLDYAGCIMDRKSISGACQILRGKLVCWSAKKQHSAIAISNNLVFHSRTKHINRIYHFIRDHILKEDIELYFIPTKYQIVDIFTKPLDEPTFTRLKAELAMLNID